MGRAYQVRKASMEKTAAAKTKVYSKYGREIYVAAKAGVPDPDMNVALRRIIEKAKKDQVPADIIKRAIDKAKGGETVNYTATTYEGFGPGASTVIVECLTDNGTRTFSDVRNCFTKSHSKIGVAGCVSHSYDHVSIITLKGMSEDEVLEALLMAEVDITNIESDEEGVTVYGDPSKLYEIKEALVAANPSVAIDLEEITWIPQNQEYITLEGEELELYERLTSMLEALDDVQNVYTNVE